MKSSLCGRLSMKKLLITCAVGTFLALSLFAGSAFAHFQVLVPSTEIIGPGDSKDLRLDLMFMHPFEGDFMEMARPVRFGVHVRGRNEDLIRTLSERKVGGFSAWQSDYKIKRPGDYVFYVEPAPYFEPAEESFIIHYTKTVVHAFGLEEGWDDEIGLKTEIIPLTRPYGIWTGNVFQGIVKAFGEPVPYAEIEVEYFANGKITPPEDPFITQVVRADQNGVFTYACPKAGWWAFAALSEDKVKMRYSDGKDYPVEIGAVFWIRVHDMP
jgi:cobalt/nickel transport protein